MLRALIALLLLPLVGCVGPTCDPVELQARLDAARPGDVVEIGACVVAGDFRVPPGVRLEGIGANVSAIEALPGNLQALQVQTSVGLVTSVNGVGVGGPSPALIRVSGGGSANLTELTIEVSAGTGIEARGGDLVVSDVVVTGPIDVGNANDAHYRDPDPASVGVYGLVLDGTDAQVERSTFEGLARAAVTSRGDSSLALLDTTLRQNLGYGLVVQGGDVSLVRTRIEQTLQGLRGEPSMAAALSDVRLVSEASSLLDNARYGLVQQGGRVEMSDTDASSNGDAALWFGALETCVVHGLTITDGVFAGLVVEGAGSVELVSSSVSGIAAQRRNIGSGDLFEDVEIGDGVHLLRVDAATLRDIELSDNGRLGLLVDLAGASPPTFEGVRVRSSGAALGAIAGRYDPGTPFVLTPEAPGTWDMGVIREGDALTNDPAWVDPLDALGAGTPATLPTAP